jgi:hypothetical protein
MLLVLKQSLLIKAHIGSLHHQNLATNDKALDRQDGTLLVRFLFLLYFAAIIIFLESPCCRHDGGASDYKSMSPLLFATADLHIESASAESSTVLDLLCADATDQMPTLESIIKAQHPHHHRLSAWCICACPITIIQNEPMLDLLHLM